MGSIPMRGFWESNEIYREVYESQTREAEILTRMEVTGNAGGRKRRKAGSEESGENVKRILAYIWKDYKFHLIAVLAGILVGVLANVQGTMFMKTLVDDYIQPMVETGSRDFGPLLLAMARVAGFLYGCQGSGVYLSV